MRIGDWSSDVCSADLIVHSYRDLLADMPVAQRAADRLEAKRFSPSLFVVYFGLKTQHPDIRHHSVLFGPRYAELLADIYDHGVLAEDFSLYLHRSEEHTSELQSLMCISYAVFCLKKKSIMRI